MLLRPKRVGAGQVAKAEESGPGELLRPIESEESGAGRVAG